jgi:hypothetical protein
MSRRERADRRERAQGNQRPGACPRTEPLQHLYKGYAHRGFMRNAWGRATNKGPRPR